MPRYGYHGESMRRYRKNGIIPASFFERGRFCFGADIFFNFWASEERMAVFLKNKVEKAKEW